MKEVNGTSYHDNTSDKVIAVLERARSAETRLRLWYGDTNTGICWHDEYDMTGTIGRSMGTIKIPILLHNKKSIGGGGILDHCIIAVACGPNNFLYKHPDLNLGKWGVRTGARPDCNGVRKRPWTVMLNGKKHTSFEHEEQASNYVKFMTGARMRK
jgi:hypothetical protein